jgi:hypothetical protein
MGLFCTTLVALGFGLLLCLFGYRLFLYLLPVWGFLFGFALGVQTLQALFGVGPLATLTSWVAGFVAGALFAVLSYLFYLIGVVLVASSLGYGLGIGLMSLIGFKVGIVSWLVGFVAAIAMIWVTLNYNLQKYVIIAATSLGGVGLIVSTLVLGVEGQALARMFTNPVRLVLGNSAFWTIAFLALAGASIAWQVWSTRDWTLIPFENRI